MLHCVSFFFFNDTATTEIYPLSLHDALPISCGGSGSSHEGVMLARLPRCHPEPHRASFGRVLHVRTTTGRVALVDARIAVSVFYGFSGAVERAEVRDRAHAEQVRPEQDGAARVQR